MKINETQFAMLNIQLSALGQTDLRDNDPAMLQTLAFQLEQALNSVRGAITVRPDPKYATIEVTLLGRDIPVEVEYTGEKDEDELYQMAKEQLKRLL